MSEILTYEMIKDAKEKLEGITRKTELAYAITFSNMSGMNVYVKTENRQRTGAFKVRGAFNKIANLTEEERSRGVIASSAGNHAQGVALAARTYKIKSTICMPNTAPISKVCATRAYGAEVVQYGNVYDECYSKAVEIQKETGATFVHPFNDPYVMAGQGTIAMEILKDLPETDAIIVPIGGGGLISGVAVAAKAIKKDIKVIGVQADVMASTKVSLNEGHIVTIPGNRTIADGIAVKTPGDLTFDIIKKYVDEVVTVTEDEIEEAIFLLAQRSKLIVEGAGATTIASIISKKVNMKGKTVVPVLSGGNIDVTTLAKIIDKWSNTISNMEL